MPSACAIMAMLVTGRPTTPNCGTWEKKKMRFAVSVLVHITRVTHRVRTTSVTSSAFNVRATTAAPSILLWCSLVAAILFVLVSFSAFSFLFLPFLFLFLHFFFSEGILWSFLVRFPRGLGGWAKIERNEALATQDQQES